MNIVQTSISIENLVNLLLWFIKEAKFYHRKDSIHIQMLQLFFFDRDIQMLQLFQGIFIYSVKERSQGPDSSHYAEKHFIFHLMFTNRHLSKQLASRPYALFHVQVVWDRS